jgi:hypothetical protein
MRCTRARLTSIIFFIVLSFILFFPSHVYADELTVSTSQSSYGLGATINVNGQLMLEYPVGSPVTDGLVAIEVADSTGALKLLRVVPVGATPSPWKARVSQVMSCNSYGSPQTSFSRGEFAYIKVTVESLVTYSIQIMITFDLFDSIGRSVSASFYGKNLGPAEVLTYRESILIPNDFFGDTAACFVNVLTGNIQPVLPRIGGQPCCSESAVALTITGTKSEASSSESASPASSPGSYSLSFKLPDNAISGDYTVYASARWNAWGMTTFDYWWGVVGDPTDINRDDKVNILDISMVAKAFGSRTGGPSYNKLADINSDNVINILDIAAVARDFGAVRIR